MHVLISCHNLFKHLSNMGCQALRQRYKDVKMRNLENAAKLRRLKFFSAYVVPAILTGEILKRLFLIPSWLQLLYWYTLELEYSMQRLFKIWTIALYVSQAKVIIRWLPKKIFSSSVFHFFLRLTPTRTTAAERKCRHLLMTENHLFNVLISNI